DAAPLMPTLNYTILATTLITFVLAYAVVRVAHALVRRLLAALDIVSSENRAAVQARAGKLLRALMLMAYGVAALASISLALARFGFGETRWDPRAIARWFVTHGVNVVVIVAGTFIVIHAANLAIAHLQFKLGRRART